MKINLEIKKQEQINAKITNFFSKQESLIEEIKTRKIFLFSFIEDELNNEVEKYNEYNMKMSRLLKEIDFLNKILNQL